MPRRHPSLLPRIWLMTDERLGDRLLDIVRRLPPGTGIVLRHYATPTAERRRLFNRVLRIARSRHLLVLRAGPLRLAAGEAGVHGRHAERGRPAIRTMPVHDPVELRLARRARADLVFLSPVFATRSHPGAPPLDRSRLRRLVIGAPAPVILLGGMNARRARSLNWRGIHGWAGIEAFSGSIARG